MGFQPLQQLPCSLKFRNRNPPFPLFHRRVLGNYSARWKRKLFDYGAASMPCCTLYIKRFHLAWLYLGYSHLLIDMVPCDIDDGGDRDPAAFSLYLRDGAHIWIGCYKYLVLGTDFLSSPIKHEGRRQFGPITAAQVSSSHALLLHFICNGYRLRMYWFYLCLLEI